MKKVIIGLLVVGVAIGGYYAYESQKSSETAADVPTDYQISAEMLMSEFEKSSDVANTKYNNTTVEISGIIADIGINGEKVDVSFELDDPMSNINVQLISNMKNNISIEVGKKVTLKGIFVGYNEELGIDVEFKEGVILN